MKSKIYPSQSQMLNATRIEVFHNLNENFGSRAKNVINRGDAFQDMNFKIDRLFAVVHNN
ncbi:MAG: hypothetical protein CMB80_20595 [Flammeovirgaceae bacterium]|nr:hypothetical protein [Flammeovirgaceae bacterium]MBR07127.1 hypothetical protein [Rickettsiales bacterium]HCX20314.1 hypothetical protein [Cytophagales bacterium]